MKKWMQGFGLFSEQDTQIKLGWEYKMSNGFQFLDIILFAMIAAFLILRLRSVLGRHKDSGEPPQKNDRKSFSADASSARHT